MKRFWELDFLRGVAIIMMIIFHLLYDLSYLSIFPVNTTSGFWRIFGYCSAVIFLSLVGCCLYVSSSRTNIGLKTSLPKKYIMRGLKIFSLGLVLTAITWIMFPREFIVFGVLHLIGFSIIILTPFIRFKYIMLFAGIFILVLSPVVEAAVVDMPYFVWLGFMYRGFSTLDYFPVFPWIAAVMFGIFAGHVFYKNKVRQHTFFFSSRNEFSRPIQYLGKHSLLIYLLHQPIIFGILLGLKNIGIVWIIA